MRTINQIQSDESLGDLRRFPEEMKGEIAKDWWGDTKFRLGMEYGYLLAILDQKEDNKIGTDYICFLDTEAYGIAEPYWCIAKKEYWEAENCLDDCSLGLDIPEFLEGLESMYEYDHRLPEISLEEQRQKLIDLGFTMLEYNV